MGIAGYRVTTLEEFVGRELGVSDWVAIDQGRIERVRRVHGRPKWFHMNEERPKRERPYGSTIAHGDRILSLLASLSIAIGIIPGDAKAGLNFRTDPVDWSLPSELCFFRD